MQQITVKDIANKLNLQYTTVSKALRNHPDISEKTKKLVISTAQEMDYHPNWIAKSFKSRRTNTIGVIVPSIKNDFYASVISGIEEITYKDDFGIMVSQSNESYHREVLNIRSFISNLVSGLIVCISQTTHSGDHLIALQKRGIPLVFFGRVCEDIETSKVVVDDYLGAFKAVEFLISSGYKTIAHFAGPQDISISRDRHRGFMEALNKHHLPVDKELIFYGGLQEEDGMRSFQKLHKEGRKLPEAIFTVNDLVAIGIYSETEKMGLKIPDDLAVIGFGNNKLSAYLNPPLTTVQQSPYNMGIKAAQIILNHIKEPDKIHRPKIEIIKPELILRKST